MRARGIDASEGAHRVTIRLIVVVDVRVRAVEVHVVGIATAVLRGRPVVPVGTTIAARARIPIGITLLSSSLLWKSSLTLAQPPRDHHCVKVMLLPLRDIFIGDWIY